MLRFFAVVVGIMCVAKRAMLMKIYTGGSYMNIPAFKHKGLGHPSSESNNRIFLFEMEFIVCDVEIALAS